jgi:hypothetical protein
VAAPLASFSPRGRRWPRGPGSDEGPRRPLRLPRFCRSKDGGKYRIRLVGDDRIWEPQDKKPLTVEPGVTLGVAVRIGIGPSAGTSTPPDAGAAPHPTLLRKATFSREGRRASRGDSDYFATESARRRF